MAKIRKINVSEIVGRNPYNQDDEAVMPSGTVVVYEKDNNGVIEYVLRVHNGVTAGGVAISPGPGPVIFNGSDGIVPSNLNDGIAALFNNADVYITGGNSVRFTGLDTDSGGSTSVLRFWNAEGRHSSGNDPTELVTLNVGNDAAPGDDTLGFFKIITEKEVGVEKEWKFDSDGVLTLPVGGDIVDNTGASVLGSSVSVDRNIWIQTFATDSETDKAALASSVEYDNLGNVYALFLHQQYNDLQNPSSVTGTYFSVAKFASTGEKLWSVRSSSANVYTDGWGLAVDNANSAFYVAGKTAVENSYDRSFLVKFSSDDGSLIWSNVYDFDSRSDSPVVDIASDGNPVIVGYLETGGNDSGNDGVTVTKINRTDGSILWSQMLDGQGDDEAYGMAVGPSGEIVAVGYTSQIGLINTVATLTADPVSNANWTLGGAITGNDGVTMNFTFTDGVPTFTDIVDPVGNRSVDDVIATVLGSSIGGVDGVDDMIVKVATVTAGDSDDRMLVVKYDTDGVIVWQKAIQFDAGYDCSGADADIDADGNVYINGNWRYDSGQAPYPTSAMSIVKFNSSGVKQWSRRVVGDCDDFTTSIVVGPENTLYLTGVTTNPADNNKYIWVVAKYTTSGTVVWQRLIENNSNWSFSGGFFGASGGGSSLAVKEGYVALSGGFGIPFNNESTAVVVQLDFDGTVFTAGDWEVKVASFSGVLSSDASDITVINAGKTDTGLTGTISIDDSLFQIEDTNFLLPILYRESGGTGDITFEGVKIVGKAAGDKFGLISLIPAKTAVGNFGSINFENFGQYINIYPTNEFDTPHIHIAAGVGVEGEGDLFLGDDNKYVQIGNDGDIQIQSYLADPGNTHRWTFGNDGSTTLPGAVVKSTVAKTGVILPTTTGTAETLSISPAISELTDGTYGPFTLGVATFSVLVVGGIINGITNLTSTGNVTVGDNLGTIDSGDIGGIPGATPLTITVSNVVQATPTALDLTKTVNKLSNGNYTLADGVEGQIMHLVRQTGSTYNAIIVNVANARVNGSLETTIDYYPFENIAVSNMSTLIFTDGAWQADNGGWD
jgi:hypothetical protein